MQRRKIQGTAVSPGLALGPVHVVRADATAVPTWSVGREEVALEVGRLASAINVASERLEERRRRVAETAGQKDAEIFAVHRMILEDPNAMRDVESAITEQRINAEAAVKLLIDRFEATMGNLDGGKVRGFASDVSDPWRFVMDVLQERDREEVVQGDEKVILAAAELTPAVVTYVEQERILGIVAEAGGRFSHGAVLARSFGVPCVVGVPNLLARLERGMVLAVDGDRGTVQIHPPADEIEELKQRQERIASRRQALQNEASELAVTPDGTELSVMANIESLRDLDTFDLAHTAGGGLLRTEFLYLERNQFPSEEEQYRLYRRVLERLDGKPATLRLLDIGGDKPLPYFHTPPETNPALGWRGIRITLQWRDLLQIQLRALLRASIYGDLRILIPMVTSIEEIEEIHALFHEVRQQLVDQGYETVEDLPVGAMIEVPSALLEVDRIFELVDFVSVGTNDLVQYLLAVDRDSAWVSQLYDPQHPAVVRALALVAAAAGRAGKPASVCGEIAGDPSTAILLLGMGFDSVSVAPQFIPEIKFAVRRTPFSRAQEWAQEALSHGRSELVRKLLKGVRNRLDNA